MNNISATRTEVAAILAPLAQTYDYEPGSAELPAFVVGMPERTEFYISSAYTRIELPVFVVCRSADPDAAEVSLLDLCFAGVDALRAVKSGTAFSSMRVADGERLGYIPIGRTEAVAYQINLDIMVNPPT